MISSFIWLVPNGASWLALDIGSFSKGLLTFARTSVKTGLALTLSLSYRALYMSVETRQ